LAQKAEPRSAQTTIAAVEPWQPALPAPKDLLWADTGPLRASSSLQPGFASSMDPLASSGPPPGLFAPGAGLRLNDLRPVSHRLGGN
jgi:hypothetical protein